MRLEKISCPNFPGNGQPADSDAGPHDPELHYRYDNVGNIMGLNNQVAVPPPNLMGGPTTQSFAYDDLYRLTQAGGTWGYAPHKRERYSLRMAYPDGEVLSATPTTLAATSSSPRASSRA